MTFSHDSFMPCLQFLTALPPLSPNPLLDACCPERCRSYSTKRKWRYTLDITQTSKICYWRDNTFSVWIHTSRCKETVRKSFLGYDRQARSVESADADIKAFTWTTFHLSIRFFFYLADILNVQKVLSLFWVAVILIIFFGSMPSLLHMKYLNLLVFSWTALFH